MKTYGMPRSFTRNGLLDDGRKERAPRTLRARGRAQGKAAVEEGIEAPDVCDITVTLPIRLVSEANSHTHWRVRQKRAKAQRFAVDAVLRSAGKAGHLAQWPDAGAVVSLTRIAPRSLDGDNLQGAFKAVRDSVAAFLGIDDRTARVEWKYAQMRGATGVYAIRIEVEYVTAVAAAEEER